MNIKIVICFIIIYFLPVASASAADWVWAAKSSGFLKNNESLVYENYLLKVTDVEGAKVTVMVYKDQVLKETKEFKVNEFNKYDDMGITLLGIYGEYSWISFSKLENRELWTPSGNTVLKWGDSYTIDNYSINIDALRTDSVNLTISNKSTANTMVFQKGGFADFGNFRIAVSNINRTGFIELDFFTYMAPVTKAEINTDKDEYYPDETVSVLTYLTSDETQNIASIILNGKAANILPNIFMAINFSGNGSFRSRMTRLPANSTVNITARIETRDYYNNAYITTVSKEIQITPEISIIKDIPEDTDDENVPVVLYIYNSGRENRSIHVRDNVLEEFSSKQVKEWTIELAPKKSANLTYYVAPQKPGTYILPGAIAQWGNQSSISRKAKMTVHMPYITLKKSAVNNKSLTDVKLIISNTGDRPAIVKVTDKIPNGYPLISGTTTWSGFMEGGDSASITYSIQGNIEVLPVANATYRDILGNIRQTQSNTIDNANAYADEMDIMDTSPINAGRNEIITFMITSFLVIAGIIGSAAFMAYLVTSLKMRLK